MIRNLTITIFLLLGYQAQSQALIQDEYMAIRNTSMEIISKFPPDKYIYVGIGRSPTPFMAFLGAKLGKESIIQLPLGGMKYFSSENPTVYTKANKALLDKHLKRILSHKIDNEKKFLFIDVSMEGLTLINTKRELERLLGPNQVEFLALTHPYGLTSSSSLYSGANIDTLNKANIPHIPIPFFLFEKFTRQEYDKFAKYKSYPVTNGKTILLPKVHRLADSQYWNELQEDMIRNINLDKDTHTSRSCNLLFKF